MEETRFIDPPSSALSVGECNEQRSDSEDVEKQPLIVKNRPLGRVSHWKWKKTLMAITILLGCLSVNAAYSTIGPFFPDKVGAVTYTSETSVSVHVYSYV